MRHWAGLLMLLGVLVGVLMAYFVFVGGPPPWGLDWMIWVGMIKLGLAGSLGLIGTGAFVRRVAIRRERRQQLAAATPHKVEQGDKPSEIASP